MRPSVYVNPYLQDLMSKYLECKALASLRCPIELKKCKKSLLLPLQGGGGCATLGAYQSGATAVTKVRIDSKRPFSKIDCLERSPCARPL